MAEKEKTTEEMLQEVIQKGQPAATAAAEGQDDAGDLAEVVAGPALVSCRQGSAVSLVSRILVLGAILLLLLGVYETYSSIPETVPGLLPRPFDSVAFETVPDGVALSEAVDRFARRRIFGMPPPQDQSDPGPVVQTRGWRAYVRDHIDLLGTSAVEDEGSTLLEGIVMDKKAGRMQFLREGTALRIEDQEVTVIRVSENQVELRREEEVIVVD